MRERQPINWLPLTDDEFVKTAETQIWLSAFANNNPRAPAHKETDAAFAEARRREKPWLYQRAWNKAYLSCGHQPSDAEIEAAREPTS
jgi:hypothetical protein